MNYDSTPLPWIFAFIIVAVDCLWALILYTIAWGSLLILYYFGLITYPNWSWYTFSVYLIFYAMWSMFIDYKHMGKKPVDSAGK
jgi:hypothetical protein